MTIEPESRARSFALNVATVVLGITVLSTLIVTGVSASATSPLPTLAANYRCAPESSVPSLEPGQSGSVTATYGDFTASFRATMPASSSNDGLVGMPFKGSLTVKAHGQRWTLPHPYNADRSQMNALCVIAFRSERHPGVMIEGFTGGAHCCEVPVIYLYDRSTKRYEKVVDMSPIDFANPHAFNANEGFIEKVVGAQVLLQTSAAEFDYAFGCYACGTDPIVFDTVDTDGLTDVTGQHPLLVADDARAIWRYAAEALRQETAKVQSVSAPFGFLAPWVADECTLGRGASAWSTIQRLQHDGKLGNAYYFKETLNHGSFVAHLHAFLLRDDYCTGQI